jgi:2-hydroxychromene-2-carboxylate isomerase
MTACLVRLNMADKDVFINAMTDAGLNGLTLFERTQDPALKAQLMSNTEKAVARGVFGIPTFFVGEEMFFGKDRLAQVEEEILA